MTHPTDPLVWQIVLRILAEKEEGRSVDPSRLAWAEEMVAKNRARMSAKPNQPQEVSA